jgi:hypothetical protein
MHQLWAFSRIIDYEDLPESFGQRYYVHVCMSAGAPCTPFKHFRNTSGMNSIQAQGGINVDKHKRYSILK